MVQTVVTVDLLAATTRLIVPAASGRLDVLAAKMAVNRRVDALAEALKILADEARPNPIPGWVEARDATGRPDRKSGGEGQSLNLGGRRSSKTKK